LLERTRSEAKKPPKRYSLKNGSNKIQEKFCAFITAAEGSTQPLEEREGLFPSFGEYMKIYEEQQPKQEAPDIAAAAASSPYMSQES